MTGDKQKPGANLEPYHGKNKTVNLIELHEDLAVLYKRAEEVSSGYPKTRGLASSKARDLITKRCLQALNNNYVVELGAFKGAVSTRLATVCKLNNKKPVICVDTWEGAEQEEQKKLEGYVGKSASQSLAEFVDYIEKCGLKEWVIPIPTTTRKAAGIIDCDIDYLFVDACYYYENVLEDVLSWVPRIVPGGIVTFDDFGCWGGSKGPEGAVRELILNNPKHFQSFTNPPDTCEVGNVISFRVLKKWCP